MMENLLLHRSVGSLSGEKIVPIDEINSINFNFPKHFSKDTIARLGRWWVCYKAKPWTRRDLMIIDSSKDFVRAIGQLSSTDLISLSQIILEAVNALKEDNAVKLIVIGGNINPDPKLSDSESIARLHVHVCGFSQEEINNLSKTKIENNIQFKDGLIEDFKNAFDLKRNSFSKYSLGLRSEIEVSDTNQLIELLQEIDSQSISALNRVKKSKLYPILSYSFAIRIKGSRADLFISPKSVNGRGVLESLGIVLKRDKKMKVDDDFYATRNNFLKKVKEKILKYPGVKSGEAKLEDDES